MAKFRKKPVVIEAVQNLYGGGQAEAVAEWCGGKFEPKTGAIYISTLEGVMRADVSDWIIQGLQGEFYPCKPDIFEATYERVED